MKKKKWGILNGIDRRNSKQRCAKVSYEQKVITMTSPKPTEQDFKTALDECETAALERIFQIKMEHDQAVKKIGLSPSFSDFIKQKVREKLNKTHRPAGICQYVSEVFNNDVLNASAALFEVSARYVLELEKNVFNAEKRMSEICNETRENTVTLPAIKLTYKPSEITLPDVSSVFGYSFNSFEKKWTFKPDGLTVTSGFFAWMAFMRYFFLIAVIELIILQALSVGRFASCTLLIFTFLIFLLLRLIFVLRLAHRVRRVMNERFALKAPEIAESIALQLCANMESNYNAAALHLKEAKQTASRSETLSLRK